MAIVPITNPSLLTDAELLRKVLQRAMRAVVHDDDAAVRASRAVDLLDDRQKIFVQRFVETRNASAAARDAGYSGPGNQATRVLGRKNVRRAIAEALDGEVAAAALTPDGMMQSCARIMRTGKPRDVLKALDTVLKIKDMLARGRFTEPAQDGKKRRGPIAEHKRGVGPSPYADLEQTVRAHGDRLDTETRTAWLVQLQEDAETLQRAIALVRGGST